MAWHTIHSLLLHFDINLRVRYVHCDCRLFQTYILYLLWSPLVTVCSFGLHPRTDAASSHAASPRRDKPREISDGERMAALFNIACCHSRLGATEPGLLALAQVSRRHCSSAGWILPARMDRSACIPGLNDAVACKIAIYVDSQVTKRS